MTAPRRAGLATRVVFFVSGATMSSWAPLVPFAQAHGGLDDRALGLVLLGLGAGSLVAMPVAGRLVARYGCRSVILAAAPAACIALSLLPLATDAVGLAVALLAFGAALGALDVAMNVQAIADERDAGRPTMSGFHALFSIGGIAGASTMSAALIAGLSPLVATFAIAVVLSAAALSTAPHLRTERSARPGPMFVVPRGAVLAIGTLCCACFLIEGAVLDWSAILLSSVRGLDVARSGIGYAAFSAAMVVGRLTGDRLVERLGRRTTLVAGALWAAGGVLLVGLAPDWQAAVAGLALVGLGCANLIPILFTAAGRQTAMPDTLALPAVATFGYAGLLAGPGLIGFAAHGIGLPHAFALLAAMMLAVAAAARRLAV